MLWVVAGRGARVSSVECGRWLEVPSFRALYGHLQATVDVTSSEQILSPGGRGARVSNVKFGRWLVDPPCRALSGRLKFPVRRHKFRTDPLSWWQGGLESAVLNMEGGWWYGVSAAERDLVENRFGWWGGGGFGLEHRDDVAS